MSLNIIIDPVKRWFHYDKEIPDETPKDLKVFTAKDSGGNEVFIFMGHETYETNYIERLST